MACFSLGWVEQLCIWLIVVIAVVAIIRAILPLLGAWIGFPIVTRIVEIVLWAVVAIMAVKIIFMLIGCLLSGGVGAFLR